MQNQVPSGQRKQMNQEMDVAFLEPIDFDKPFPTHPVAIGKILSTAHFNGFNEISKLGRFRFKIKLNDTSMYVQIERVNFAAHNLNLFVPKSLKETTLIIKGVPPEFDIGEIKEYMVSEYQVTQVERIMRKGNSEELRPTSNIKIIVKGKQAPKPVRIYGCFFRTEVYVFPVKQCLKCWRFGHTVKFCRSKQRCKHCGKDHDSENCTQPTGCLNCHQNHSADNRNCAERERRVQILKQMRIRGMTYAEAELNFPKLENRFQIPDLETDFPDLVSVTQDDEICNQDTTRNIHQGNWRKLFPRTRPLRSVKQTYNQSHQQDLIVELNDQIGNNISATVVEEMLAQVRIDLLRQLRLKTWLKPLLDLRDQLASDIQKPRTDLDSDQLLIQTFGKINNILEVEAPVNAPLEKSLEK